MDELRIPTDDDLVSISTEFNKKSEPGGIRLSYERGSYVIAPVFPLPSDDPEELITGFLKGIGLDRETANQAYGESLYDKAYEYFAEGGDMNYGFVGVTNRDMKWFEENDPDFLSRLNNMYGKVVFVGNGLSTMPIELMQRNPDISAITLVDMIDVQKVHDQLLQITQKFEEQDLEVPNVITSRLNDAQRILNNRDDKIKLEQRTFGLDQPDSENFHSADFVVNSYGPPSTTEAEQRKYLRPEAPTDNFLQP